MKVKRSKDVPPAPPAPKGGFRHNDRALIPEASLTFREQKVLGALRACNSPATVRALARSCFPGLRAKPGTYELEKADGTKVRHGTGAAYRCVLNAMRRLIAGGFANKVDRGTYIAVDPRSGQSSPTSDQASRRITRRASPTSDTKETTP